MEKQIQAQLQELEQSHQITILFAVESGSRAWGFPSPDSDYDVRFLYQHAPEWYLSLDEPKDTLTRMHGDLDLSGWDLRKALRLLRKSNAALLEQLQSPILYRPAAPAVEEMQALAPAYFSAKAGLHHYLSMAFRYARACAPETDVKLKSYFYLLRAALASLWIVEKQTIPPMQFQALLPLVDNPEMLQRIQQLLVRKAEVGEQYDHPKEQALEDYLFQLLQRCEAMAGHLPIAHGASQALDKLFRNSLLSHGPLT